MRCPDDRHCLAPARRPGSVAGSPVRRRERAQPEWCPADFCSTDSTTASRAAPLKNRQRQATDGEDLIGPQRRIESPGSWFTSTTSNRQPRSTFQKRARMPFARRSRCDAHGPASTIHRSAIHSALSHSACSSTGFPIRGVTTQSPIFTSIQVSCIPARRLPAIHRRRRECDSACRECSRPKSHRTAMQQRLPIVANGFSPRASRADEIIVNGNDIPQRGIDRIEFR